MSCYGVSTDRMRLSWFFLKKGRDLQLSLVDVLEQVIVVNVLKVIQVLMYCTLKVCMNNG